MKCERCGYELINEKQEIRDFAGQIKDVKFTLRCEHCGWESESNRSNGGGYSSMSKKQVKIEYMVAIGLAATCAIIYIIGLLLPYVKILNQPQGNLFKLNLWSACIGLICALCVLACTYKTSGWGGAFFFVGCFICNLQKVKFNEEVEEFWGAMISGFEIDKAVGYYMLLISSILGFVCCIYFAIRKEQLQK